MRDNEGAKGVPLTWSHLEVQPLRVLKSAKMRQLQTDFSRRRLMLTFWVDG